MLLKPYLTQLTAVLSRHGARFPTADASLRINDTLNKIKSATSFSKKTAFIKSFKYSLGSDDLTPFGEQELYNSGVKFYRRYASLAKDYDPFFRVAGQERVVDSGRHFATGFVTEKIKRTGHTIPFPPLLEIDENERSNNTLHPTTCCKFNIGKHSKKGDKLADKYAAIFAPPILVRLNNDMPGIKNLTYKDITNLISLCPFYTVDKLKGDPLPKFCDIFSDDEFKSYNYYTTLSKYYQYGPGNKLGPTLGIGYVNELIARLTNSPVKDFTTSNTTLDGNPATFPLDRKLYADFSHDNTMVSVFSAMNLFQGLPALSTKRIEAKHQFNLAELVPFASRMYVEKLQCEGEDEELVRVFINDKLMKLKGCDIKQSGGCTLSDFVESLKWAREGGNWATCGPPTCFDDLSA
ncbi:hypothetical protein ABW20_dc0108916 [Dactylellina cionopaga]|nr:hypothetical protein ABW20_dc0108916 [Dactylellina cionopaga]